MCTRTSTFILLVWIVGLLHAQTPERICDPPSLTHGYFLPDDSTFRHGSKLTYSCDKGYKPAVEGWWAAATCQNGKWSHEPRCIDENACLPPIISNAGFAENSKGWYEAQSELIITCYKGYEQKGQDMLTTCVDGSWTPVSGCRKRLDACSVPPQAPHAVIISEEFQAVFAADSQVQYECKNGLRTEDGNTKKIVSCVSGNWTEGPKCTSWTNSGTNRDETERDFTTIDRCGEVPIIQNGVVVQTAELYFKYKCAHYYKPEGSGTVKCRTDGSWSPVPNCKADYCSVDTATIPRLINVGKKFLENGGTVRLECVTNAWEYRKYSDIQCTDNTLHSTQCCTEYKLYWNYCGQQD